MGKTRMGEKKLKQSDELQFLKAIADAEFCINQIKSSEDMEAFKGLLNSVARARSILDINKEE